MKSIDRFSVCIDTVFPHDLGYEERIRRTASLGFSRYEFWFHDMIRGKNGWIEKENVINFEVLARLRDELSMKLVCFAVNDPAGMHGGHLLDETGSEVFLRRLQALLPEVRRLEVPFLIGFPGFWKEDTPRDAQLEHAVRSLREASAILRDTGVQLLFEPLSEPKYRGFMLPTVHDALSLIKRAAVKEVKVLFDFYHVQMMTGNLLNTITENLHMIGHVHLSSVPGQNEPANGELQYPWVLKEMLKNGYRNYFGLEYKPSIDSEESLRNTKRYFADI